VELLDSPTRLYGVVALAPNAKRLAVHVGDVMDYIWIYDLERREGRRLSISSSAGWPVWGPDSAKIVFSSAGDNGFKALIQNVDEGGGAQELPHASEVVVGAWSGDGRMFLLEDGQVMSVEGKPLFTNLPKLQQPGGWATAFSPDNKWIAYASATGSRREIWVRSVENEKIAHQISTGGGIEARWCRCGELFYRNGNRWYSSKITTSPEFHWDPPRLVFETDFVDTPGLSYDISPDGQRLLVVKPAQPDVQNKIHVMANWFQ
jgi:WD40 repeat protein